MIPFLLVHEMLLNMVSKGGNRLGQLAELLPDSPLFNLRKAFCVKNHLDWMKTIAIGFHGDGVPHSKKGSAQVFSWNVLGKSLAERFLFTCIAKEFCCKCGCHGRCTLDAIINIYVWSMRCLCVGANPTCRHDNTPFHVTGKSRAKRARDQPIIPFRGLLLECRGDWSWYKELFGFPSWSNESICWRCKANKSTLPFTEFSKESAWRKIV